jgi:cytochrome c5
MLKPFLFLSAVILLVLAPVNAPTYAAGRTPQDAAQAAPATANPVKPTAASQEKAKKIYGVDCEICHGASGDGKTDLAKDMQLTLADWTDPKSLAGKSDKELFEMIRNGKDKMPPEGDGRAKNDEVWNLIIYIRNMSKGQPAAAAPADAAKPTN